MSRDESTLGRAAGGGGVVSTLLYSTLLYSTYIHTYLGFEPMYSKKRSVCTVLPTRLPACLPPWLGHSLILYVYISGPWQQQRIDGDG